VSELDRAAGVGEVIGHSTEERGVLNGAEYMISQSSSVDESLLLGAPVAASLADGLGLDE